MEDRSPRARSIFWEADDVVDIWALGRGIASALPDVAFRIRYEHPMPIAAIAALRLIEDTDEIAAGRPALVPADRD